MMKDMKALASALALVLVGLFGVWLWFDATSDAAQDTAGVVVVSSLEPEAVSTDQVPGDDSATTEDSADPADPAAEERAGAAEEQLQAADEVDELESAAAPGIEALAPGAGDEDTAVDAETGADELRDMPWAGDDARTGEARTESLALVRAILALASTIGIETIAEGVETARQQEVLLQLGCRYGQGFLYGRPKPAGEGPDGISGAAAAGAGHDGLTAVRT